MQARQTSDEVLLFTHRRTQRHQPIRNLGFALKIILVNEKSREQLSQEKLQLDLAQRRRQCRRIELQQARVKVAARIGVHLEARRQHRRRQLPQKTVVLKQHAETEKTIQVVVDCDQPDQRPLRIRHIAVQIIWTKETDVPSRQQPTFAIDLLHHGTGHQQDNLGKISRLRRRTEIGTLWKYRFPPVGMTRSCRSASVGSARSAAM